MADTGRNAPAFAVDTLKSDKAFFLEGDKRFGEQILPGAADRPSKMRYFLLTDVASVRYH